MLYNSCSTLFMLIDTDLKIHNIQWPLLYLPLLLQDFTLLWQLASQRKRQFLHLKFPPLLIMSRLCSYDKRIFILLHLSFVQKKIATLVLKYTTCFPGLDICLYIRINPVQKQPIPGNEVALTLYTQLRRDIWKNKTIGNSLWRNNHHITKRKCQRCIDFFTTSAIMETEVGKACNNIAPTSYSVWVIVVEYFLLVRIFKHIN